MAGNRDARDGCTVVVGVINFESFFSDASQTLAKCDMTHHSTSDVTRHWF